MSKVGDVIRQTQNREDIEALMKVVLHINHRSVMDRWDTATYVFLICASIYGSCSLYVDSDRMFVLWGALALGTMIAKHVLSYFLNRKKK